MTPNRGPGGAKIIDALYPGVQLIGKTGEEDSPRKSNWSAVPLDDKQIAYGASNGYWPAVAYLRMSQIVVPKNQIPLSKEQATDGLPLTIYSRGRKGRVAEGVVRKSSRSSVDVTIDLNESTKIYSLGAIVDSIGPNGNIAGTISLGDLQNDVLEDSSGSLKVTIW